MHCQNRISFEVPGEAMMMKCFVFGIVLFPMQLFQQTFCENFSIGYMTGSIVKDAPVRDENDSWWIFDVLPGQYISGAIVYALNEINNDSNILPDDYLYFEIAETHSLEFESIKRTLELWSHNVSVIIGPQETCVHEAKIAASASIPMISYVRV